MLETIKLGAHELDVFPQRHAYLTNKLSKYVDRLTTSGTDISDARGLTSFLGSEAYDLLIALIPQYEKRCPRYEFMGYASQAACDAGDYEEEHDKSPTFDEIIEAFTVSARVQRFDTLKILGSIFDPKMMRGWINAQMATALTRSASLPSVQDGADPLTSSGTNGRTSVESTDSPSPDSKPSHEPTAQESITSGTN